MITGTSVFYAPDLHLTEITYSCIIHIVNLFIICFSARCNVLIYHEGKLLLSCLEAAMTKHGGGVNKFEFNRFLGLACSLQKQGLKQTQVKVG